MADIVSDVLGLPNVMRIAFTYGTIIVGNAGFKAVADALTAGKITIVVNARLGGNTAIYSYKHNRFSFGFADAGGNADKQSLVVHEAVHAGFDVASTPMLVKESEGLAYIAQCLYYYYANESAYSGGSKPTFGDPILKAAWPVSQVALTKPALDAEDMKPLFKAISVHPLYKKRYEATDKFDGV